MEPLELDRRKVQVLTPRTYELIGRIVTKASYLEFAIFFMATSANVDLERNFTDVLKSRPVLLKRAKDALDKYANEMEIPNFLSRELYFEKVDQALDARDAVAHGIIQRIDELGFMAYHPRGQKNVPIDDQSLEEIYSVLDKLEAEAYLMRNIIWERMKDSGLIQIGALDTDHLDIQPGTRLG